jgi:heme/copper-type cytochrome/quinol oxidase subunit 4
MLLHWTMKRVHKVDTSKFITTVVVVVVVVVVDLADSYTVNSNPPLCTIVTDL